MEIVAASIIGGSIVTAVLLLLFAYSKIYSKNEKLLQKIHETHNQNIAQASILRRAEDNIASRENNLRNWEAGIKKQTFELETLRKQYEEQGKMYEDYWRKNTEIYTQTCEKIGFLIFNQREHLKSVDETIDIYGANSLEAKALMPIRNNLIHNINVAEDHFKRSFNMSYDAYVNRNFLMTELKYAWPSKS